MTTQQTIGPWIRLRDQQPPVNTKLLVLVDGVIREGYIDEVLLMGDTEPTRFQTVRYPDKGYMFDWQHSYWGYDPYWMLAPEKPVQEVDPKRNVEHLVDVRDGD